jgi:LemA protein
MNNLLVSGGMVALIVIAVLLILAIVVIAWWISTSNKLVRVKNKVEEAWATIDVYLKKRYDLIPNLVETVKGYAKYEGDTLEKVVQARNIAGKAVTSEEKISAANNLSNSLRTFLNVVAENYPDLKANTNFLDLQNQLKNIEGELESSRRYYNGTVKSFNTLIEIFPSCIVAKNKGEDYKKRPYFELDSIEERQNVKVSF